MNKATAIKILLLSLAGILLIVVAAFILAPKTVSSLNQKLNSLIGGLIPEFSNQKQTKKTSSGKVLGLTDEQLKTLDQINFNLPAIFNDYVNIGGDIDIAGNALFEKDATVSGTMNVEQNLIVRGQQVNFGTASITAGNVLYSVTGGPGISITTGQTPTITNTGVLSLQGETGALELEEGDNITIDGLKISADIPDGSDAFKTFSVSGQSDIVADSTSDTFTFTAGSNIALTTTESSDSLTIGLSGTIPATNGGTGLNTYSTGDLLYSSATNTLAARGIGSTGQVLTVVGGVPTWASVSGASCSNCVFMDPSSSQTITPTAGTATGLTVAQASGGSVDIFRVTNNAGSTEYLEINSSGNVATSGNVSVGGTLGVSGATTLSSTLGVSGATTLSSTLGVSGLSTLVGISNSSGITNTGGITNSGGLNNSSGGITNAGSITGATGLTSSGTITFSGLGTGIVHSNGSGVLSSSALNLAGGATEVTGSLPATNGGTGQSTYTTGDLLYSSATNVLSKLGIGASDQILAVVGGVPTWATAGDLGIGGTCSNCILTDPGSTQTIIPSAGTATGLSVRAASGGNSADIFNVADAAGTTKYLTIEADGDVILGNGGISTGTFTVNPTGSDPLAITPNTTGLNSFTGTITSADLTATRTWTLPDATGIFCLSTGNCNGSGTNLSGSGTQNFIAKFSGQYGITDSQIFDNGTNVGINDSTPSFKLDVNGTLNATGATTFGSTLGVTGNTTLSAALDVTGAADLSSTLDVTGATTLSSTLGVTGNATFNGLVGVGTTPTTKLQVLATTEQLRLNYDVSNYSSFTVGSSGDLTIAATGADVIIPVGTHLTARDSIFFDDGFGNAAELLTSAGDILYLTNATMVVRPDGSTNAFEVAGVPSAGSSGNILSSAQTLNAMNGSDTVRGLYLNLTNGNHTGSSNIFNGIQISGITGDAEATETGLSIGSGWDYAAVFDGNVGIGDTSPTALFTVGSGDAFQVNASGAIAAATGITSSGTVTFSGLGAGVVQANSSGVLSSSALNLAGGSSLVTGTLPATNGGTAQSTYTTGDILYASATNTLSKLGIGSASDVLTVSGGIPVWTTVASAGGMTSFTAAGDSGGGQAISNGNTLSILGGTNGLDTVDSATDTITLNLDTTEIGTTTFGSGSGITWTFDAGATDPTIAFGSNTMNLTAGTVTATGNLSVTGNSTVGDASGDTLTANADAWTFANDTNFALTGGINGLSIDGTTFSVDGANNRVGIGTAAPSVSLHIVGNGAGAGGEIYAKDGGATLMTQNGGYALQVGNNTGGADSVRFRIGANGIIEAGESIYGSVTTPQYSFMSDTDTGIYTSAANTLDFAAGGVRALQLGTTASAVNYLALTPAATGNSPTFTAAGSDSNVGLNLVGKGTGTLSFTSTATTGTTTSSAFAFNANSLTTGTGLYLASSSLTSGTLQSLSSTSTALTSGGLMALDWTPGSATTGTGDLLSLNIGPNGNIGNLLNIKDNGSSLFSVSETAITSALPHSFTAAGDVSFANNIAFTNQTASAIKSNASLAIEAGELFESNDLTLRTYNSGQLVIDTPGGATIQNAAFNINNSSGSTLFTVNSSGNITEINDVAYSWPSSQAAGSGYTLSNNGSGTLSWVAGTTNPWTDGSGITYLTDTAEDFAVGGSALASAFSVDVSANTARIGTGSTANAILDMYGSDGDTGSLSYTTSDAWLFSGGSVGIGATSTADFTISGSETVMDAYISNTLTGSTNVAGLSLNRGDQANGYALNYLYSAGSEVWQYGLRAGNDNFHLRYQDTTEVMTILTSGNVGINDQSPAALFTVGAGDLFQVDSSGRVFAPSGTLGTSTLAYSFTGDTNTGLYNSAADTLDFAAGGVRALQLGTTASAVNYLALTPAATGNSPTLTAAGSDSNVGLNFVGKGTGTLAFTSSATTGTTTSSAFTFNANSLTTGTGMYLASSSLTSGTLQSLSSTSTALTSGGLMALDWTPGSATTATGDLLSLNIGPNGSIGNLLNIKDNGTSLFSVSETAITSAVPHSFTAAGDVAVAYDIQFTNQTASYLKSNAPLYIEAGESFESNDLTLQTYNSGSIALDTGATGTIDLLNATTFGTRATFTAADTTPDVSAGSHFVTAGTATITDFDAGSGTLKEGHIIFVECNSAVTFDVTSSGLNGGTTDIVCAAGDMTTWIYNGTDWNLIGWMDDSTNGGQDIAEWFVGSETLEPGDVVAIDENAPNEAYVKKSGNFKDRRAMGIVATQPGIVLGEPATQNAYPIALAGRVPVKVSTEKGTIQKGDYLTSSSTPGVAVKATTAGQTIGKALESYSSAGVGKITAFVNLAGYDPDSYLDSIASANFTNNGSSYALANAGSAISRLGLFSDAAIANLTTGVIDAKEIKLNGTSLQDFLNTSAATSAVQVGDTSNSVEMAEVYKALDDEYHFETSISSLIIKKDLIVDAALNVKGDVTIEGNLIVKGKATFEDETLFNKVSTFVSNVIFRGKVSFEDTVAFNKDTAGIAIIEQNSDHVNIVFDKEYEQPPLITATMVHEGEATASAILKSFYITEKTTKGFTIKLDLATLDDTSFNWVAIAVKDPKTARSSDIILSTPSPTVDPLVQEGIDKLMGTPIPTQSAQLIE
jgi:hypothetical protein